MDKVVNIEKRIASKKQKKQRAQYRGRIEAIQKLIQCSACNFRCAQCGHQLRDSDSSDDSAPSSFGLAFCDDCKREFDDFLAISTKGQRPDAFWHNKEWVEMWSAWLDYRESINAFMNSPEFKLLLEELDSHL